MLQGLRLATYNLENLDDSSHAPALSERIAALAPRLAALDADVLCLQEVNSRRRHPRGHRELTALDALVVDTPYAGFHRAWTRDRRGKGALDIHNLVVLSRFPIIACEQFQNDLVRQPFYRPATAEPPAKSSSAIGWDRPLLHVGIDIGQQRPLHVVNLHLRAPLAAFVSGQKETSLSWRSVGGWAEGFFLASMKRTGQALEARLLVDRLLEQDPDAIIAVCGDFNADRREMPLRILMGEPDDTGNARLAPHALAALEDRVASERRFSVIHAGRRLMLDHILASRALARRCRSVDVLNDGLPDEAVPPEPARRYAGSYHAPVTAVFEIE
jgi:endonuclease/exonuclease/phosphatase family metal-dependent hydrolase